MHPLLDRSLRSVVGHRGNCAHAPENTMESLRQAVALGVDALEFDVHATADGRVVVLHDPTVDRTTEGRGPVAGMTFAEVERLDAGARFRGPVDDPLPYAGRGIGIPAFDEALAEFATMPLLIEIKAPAASTAVRAAIERAGAVARCIVASFLDEALIPFRGSGIAIGASRRATARLLLPALVGWPRRHVPFDVLCMPPDFHGVPLPVGGYAKTLAAAGVPVHVWTVDDAATARSLWRRGVSGIISNDPATILAERRRPGTA